jgi:hypothetical protein
MRILLNMDTVAPRVSVHMITAVHRPSQAFEISKAGPCDGFYASLKVCNSNLYLESSSVLHIQASRNSLLLYWCIIVMITNSYLTALFRYRYYIAANVMR